jgi:RNA polymerase sigma-70 factor (ECF subfamily)
MIEQRLRRAAGGDADSWRFLLAQHHDRLRRMIAVRMDPRLQGRIDPSDVLQDAYLEAANQLGDFARNPTVPFFLWLRRLAKHQLGRTHRRHLGAQQRDAGREVHLDHDAGSDVSSAVLAACLLGSGQRPSEEVAHGELCARLQAVLERLNPADRDVLALRHFEQLSTAETALVLGIGAAAAGKRYIRALTRLRKLLADDPKLLEGWQP